MKIIYKEFSVVNYKEYQFPYCVYAIKEQGDHIADIYERGFLPYSNDLAEEKEIYYLARSIRIQLEKPFFNYKQNNILNKFRAVFKDENLCFSLLKKEELINNADFRNWCIQNARGHFLSSERLVYILSRPYLKDILTISYEGKTLAYLLLIHEPGVFAHVWFSFYNLSLPHNDTGKWILLKTMLWLSQNHYPLFYIGTCYSKPAFYKLMLSTRSSYFDGEKWNEDIHSLKNKLLA